MFNINLLCQEARDHAPIKTCGNRELDPKFPVRRIDVVDEPSEIFVRKAGLFSNRNISGKRRGLSKWILIQVVPSLTPIEESPKATDVLRRGGFCTYLKPPGNKTVYI